MELLTLNLGFIHVLIKDKLSFKAIWNKRAAQEGELYRDLYIKTDLYINISYFSI